MVKVDCSLKSGGGLALDKHDMWIGLEGSPDRYTTKVLLKPQATKSWFGIQTVNDKALSTLVDK